ncbi:hypothetical protein [Nostoc sp.]
MNKNSEVRIQKSEWAKRPATANRSQNEDAMLVPLYETLRVARFSVGVR